MRSRAWWLALFTTVGCSPFLSPGDVQLVAPSTPTGTVTGQVSDVQFNPLSGVQVTLTVPGLDTDAGSLQTTTDANGQFEFQAIPAGSSLLVSMHKDGFADQQVAAQINAWAGGNGSTCPGPGPCTVPTSNANAMVGPFTLAHLTGTLSLRIFTHDGYPANGAKVQVYALPTAGLAIPQLTPFFPHGYPLGQLTVEGTADANGLVTVSGLPDPADVRMLYNTIFDYIVSVQALDQNGDGIPDSGGTLALFAASQLIVDPSTRFIKMPDARTSTPFRVLETNVPSLTLASSPPVRNMLKPAENLYVLFSQAVEPGSISVRMVDESGKTAVSLSPPTLSAGGTLLTITPSGSLQLGQEYNLEIHAISQDSGARLDLRGYFFVGDPMGTGPAVAISNIGFKDANANGKLDPGEQVTITFNQPLGEYGLFFGGPLIAYFNADLDGSGTVGDAPGERGYTGDGFEIDPFEPVSDPGTLFILKPSGYTTRWSLFYTGGPTIPTSTAVDLVFNHLTDPVNAGVQTLWSQPLTTTYTKGLSVTP